MTTLAKKDILIEIKKRTPLGLQIFKAELDYYLKLIEQKQEKVKDNE